MGENKGEIDMAKGVFEDVELAFDLQQYLLHSKDVKVSQKVKDKIVAFNPDTLLSVTKKIQSPLEILDAIEVDDKFIKSAFSSVNF